VVKHKEKLATVHMAVAELLKSRLITDQTRRSAEILKTHIEAELAHEAVSGEQSHTSVIPIESKALNKKVAGRTLSAMPLVTLHVFSLRFFRV
jgi:hypothetical protein